MRRRMINSEANNHTVELVFLLHSIRKININSLKSIDFYIHYETLDTVEWERSMNKNVTIAGKSFEDLKQINEHGAEYWSARALQFLLGYSQWRRFEQAIDRAISSCKESGNPPEPFCRRRQNGRAGSGSERIVEDYCLRIG